MVSYLARVDILSIIEQPQTLADCKENIVKVLSILKQKRSDFPSKLCGGELIIEKLMKRDKQVLYSILHFLMSSYYDVMPIKQNISIL